jgi:hypothetical protein
MLQAWTYRLSCDPCGARLAESNNRFRLADQARDAGWKLRRRRDGQYALSGGKDYCPACVPETWQNVP